MNDQEATAEQQRLAKQNRRRSRVSGPCPSCEETDHAYYSHEDEQVVCGVCDMAGPIAQTEALAWEAWIDLPRKGGRLTEEREVADHRKITYAKALRAWNRYGGGDPNWKPRHQAFGLTEEEAEEVQRDPKKFAAQPTN